MAGFATRFPLALLDLDYNPLATVDDIGTILRFELMPGGVNVLGTPFIITLIAVALPAALPLLTSALALLAAVRRRAA